MNPQRSRRPQNRSAEDKARAKELLRPAMDDLKALMEKAKQMIGAEAKLEDVLDVLEGFGRASTRIARLLKAEQELAGGGDDLEEEIDQAINELFGHLPSFQHEGYDGTKTNENVPPE